MFLILFTVKRVCPQSKWNTAIAYQFLIKQISHCVQQEIKILDLQVGVHSSALDILHYQIHIVQYILDILLDF